MSRLLEFDNILNARDFGGYEVEQGSLVRAKLFRTAHMANASETDVSKLADMDVGLIIDLRYLSEREREPNRWPEGSRTKTLAFNAKRSGVAPHEAFVKQDLNVANDAINYMTQTYAARPHESAFKRLFADALTHMAETGDAVIVHCAAGKDRTGTLVALIQGLLGVSEVDIMDDYLMTMQAVNVEAVLKMALPRIEQRYGRSYAFDALLPMFGVRPDYLHASLEAIGDMQDYARNTLGLSAEILAKLKAQYISPAP